MTVSEDFTGLTSRFRGELLAHCYRMLGSVDEAEDLVQETFLRAWRSYERFEGRSSVRTWLYRIATNVCLTAIERRGRRPLPSGLGGPAGDPEAPLEAASEVPWLQPLPDALVTADLEDPAAVTASRAGVRLAFVAALQYLSARQRAMLILRDVLEWPAADVAELLGTTTTAINSGLRRARTQLARVMPAEDELAEPDDAVQRAVLERFAAAIERADARAMAELLRADVVSGDAAVPDVVRRPGCRGGLRRVAAAHRAGGRPAGAGDRERAGGVRRLPARRTRGVPGARAAGAHAHRDRHRPDRRLRRPGPVHVIRPAAGGPGRAGADVGDRHGGADQGLELLGSAVGYALASTAMVTPQLLPRPAAGRSGSGTASSRRAWLRSPVPSRSPSTAGTSRLRAATPGPGLPR